MAFTPGCPNTAVYIVGDAAKPKVLCAQAPCAIICVPHVAATPSHYIPPRYVLSCAFHRHFTCVPLILSAPSRYASTAPWPVLPHDLEMVKKYCSAVQSMVETQSCYMCLLSSIDSVLTTKSFLNLLGSTPLSCTPAHALHVRSSNALPNVPTRIIAGSGTTCAPRVATTKTASGEHIPTCRVGEFAAANNGCPQNTLSAAQPVCLGKAC